MGLLFQFVSELTSLAWVPNQSIPVLLMAAMILMDRGDKSLARVILGYGLLSLWCPFGMIGLLPLVLLRVAQDRRRLIKFPTLTASFIGVTFALSMISYLTTELPKGGLCLTCVAARSNEILRVAVFLVIDLFPFALLLRRKLLTDQYCATALTTLIVIPFFHGDAIDFVARGSIGPLFILALRSTEQLLNFQAVRRHLIPVTLALAACLPTTLSELTFHLQKGAVYRTLDPKEFPEAAFLAMFSTSTNINAREFLDACGWNYESQYFSHSKPKLLKSSH